MSTWLRVRPYKPKKAKAICQGGFKYWVADEFGNGAILDESHIERLHGAGSALKQLDAAEEIIEMIKSFGRVEVFISE